MNNAEEEILKAAVSFQHIFETYHGLPLSKVINIEPVSEALVSSCCGSHEQCLSNGNPQYDEDTSICAACKGNCIFIPESEYCEAE